VVRVLCLLLLMIGLLQLYLIASARAGMHGAVFVYESNAAGEGILTPMMAPEIGVQLKQGPREINHGEVLVCKQGREVSRVKAIDGQDAEVVEFRLDCDKRIFILKSIHFSEQ